MKCLNMYFIIAHLETHKLYIHTNNMMKFNLLVLTWLNYNTGLQACLDASRF